MDVLGIYIFNSSRNQWLQEDEKSWGSFGGACEFTPGNEETAEAIRERETPAGETSFTMAALH